ncbi:hypothetical protein BV372_30630 [Nostoc sp. T09]|nr:hypothetical protein BV372_30630 [Nostoc sp. T09]
MPKALRDASRTRLCGTLREAANASTFKKESHAETQRKVGAPASGDLNFSRQRHREINIEII